MNTRKDLIFFPGVFSCQPKTFCFILPQKGLHMKTIISVIFITIFLSFAAQARTIQMISKFDTVYGCDTDFFNKPKLTVNFGKILHPGDYGVFARFTCRSAYDDHFNRKKREQTNTFFFRPIHGEIIREGKSLFLIEDGKKTKLANKKLLRWKPVNGVKINKSFIGDYSRYEVKVSLEIN